MIAYSPSSKNSKKYYAIGEVAQLLHVSTSLIRFWEKKITSLQPKKNEKGARRYTQADIARLHKVYHLVKEQGYTLQGAKAAMKHSEQEGRGNNKEVLQALKNLRGFLVDLRSLLCDDAQTYQQATEVMQKGTERLKN